MRSTLFSFLLLSFFCSLSYGQISSRDSNPGFRSQGVYHAEEYAIAFPPDWTLDTSGLLGTQFIVTAPQSSDQDFFRENVSLMIKDSKNLHNFVKASETRIQNSGTLLESRRRINDNRQEYHMIVYTINEQPDLVYEQYYFFKYWFLYELTCVYERKNFEDNRKQGEWVLNTFRFKFPWSY
ncbi:MAG: hypothetical protein K0R51_67 [Cytophagaceae bacterium]|jgi:hypothetical protein|nr:hypothetical protein [Cytophagaceae bacterium]